MRPGISSTGELKPPRDSGASPVPAVASVADVVFQRPELVVVVVAGDGQDGELAAFVVLRARDQRFPVGVGGAVPQPLLESA